MTALIIPDLQRKLDVLLSRQVFAGKDEIARHLGKSLKTVNWWAHGSSAREPGLIPPDSEAAMLMLFASCFPEGTSEIKIKNALMLSGAEFERAVQLAWSPSWETVLSRHANATAGKLLMRPGEIGLVEIDAPSREDGPIVPLGAWFRIEFQSEFTASHIYACQQAPSGIGPVPAKITQGRGIQLPSPTNPGQSAYMRERADAGRHVFVAIQSARALPADLAAPLSGGLPLETSLLQRVAAHLMSIPLTQWRIFALSVTIDSERG